MVTPNSRIKESGGKNERFREQKKVAAFLMTQLGGQVHSKGAQYSVFGVCLS